jgi:putative intracellular protease/amidase
MSNELTGKRVAILVTDGVEQPEFVAPRDTAVEAGAAAEAVSLLSWLLRPVATSSTAICRSERA